MNLLWLVVVVLLILSLVGSPVAFGWYGTGWGGSGAGMLIVIVLIVLLASGRL